MSTTVISLVAGKRVLPLLLVSHAGTELDANLFGQWKVSEDSAGKYARQVQDLSIPRKLGEELEVCFYNFCESEGCTLDTLAAFLWRAKHLRMNLLKEHQQIRAEECRLHYETHDLSDPDQQARDEAARLSSLEELRKKRRITPEERLALGI